MIPLTRFVYKFLRLPMGHKATKAPNRLPKATNINNVILVLYCTTKIFFRWVFFSQAPPDHTRSAGPWLHLPHRPVHRLGPRPRSPLRPRCPWRPVASVGVSWNKGEREGNLWSNTVMRQAGPSYNREPMVDGGPMVGHPYLQPLPPLTSPSSYFYSSSPILWFRHGAHPAGREPGGERDPRRRPASPGGSPRYPGPLPPPLGPFGQRAESFADRWVNHPNTAQQCGDNIHVFLIVFTSVMLLVCYCYVPF